MKFFWYGIFLFIVGYLATLGCRPMVAPDEFRHAEIVREMQVSGNALSPHLIGVRYFEKPILTHHCNLASMKLFGNNHFGLRFPAALFTLLTGGLIALVIWQRRKDAKLAALAFGFYMSFLLVYGIGIMPLTDAPLTFFTTAATFCAFLAAVEEKFTKRKVTLEICCGLALAGGFYAKGALGLAVPGISIAAFLIWDKRWKEFYRLPLLIVPVMLAAILPLAWKIHQAEPEFWKYFIQVEHIQRFTQDARGQHPQPWWFFFPVLFVGALPGITFLPCLLRVKKDGWKTLLSRPIYRMALCALVLPFILVSLSHGKMITYILPCFPALAILLAGGVMTYLRSSLDGRAFNATIRFWTGVLWAAGAVALIMGVLVVCGATPLFPAQVRDLLPALRNLFFVAGIAAILFGTALFFVRHMSRTLILTIFFTGVAAMSCAVTPFISDRIDNGIMPEESIASLIQQQEVVAALKQSGVDLAQADVIAAPAFSYAVAWQLKRADVRIYRAPGELRYGCELARRNGEKDPVIQLNEIQSMIAKGERPILYFTSPCKEQLKGLTPKLRLIDQNVQLDVY